MIGKLFGKIDSINSGQVIIRSGDVGYIVYCSNKVTKSYNIGDQIELITKTIVKENDISIFGFIDHIDKELFNHFLNIQGVGPRLAQIIVEHLNLSEIIHSIQINDEKKLVQIPGVGPRLATRIIHELKSKNFIEKAKNIDINNNKIRTSSPNSQTITDAKSALVNLGYNITQINTSVHHVISTNNSIKLEELIKECIKLLSS